jgi:glucan phosphorylase
METKKKDKQTVCVFENLEYPTFSTSILFFSCDVSIIVQQTPLCVHGSSRQVNGVAAIHTEIIKKESFNSQLLKGGVYYWLTYRILT